MPKNVASALVCSALLACGHHPIARQSYRWQQVAVGGGGYVTGLVAHSTEAATDRLLIRTDVGGAYRLDAGLMTWVPLLDSFARKDWHLYGVESLAVDPRSADILYAALGKYLPRPWLHKPSGVYKSTDGGATWTATPLRVPMGGNENYRWVGERLAIDPLHPQVIYFGSRLDGLFRSRDGGASWQAVSGLAVRGTDEVGITFVIIDRQALYVGVFGAGVQLSEDGGQSFRSLAQPRLHRPQRAALASDGSLYVAFAGEDKQRGAVARYAHGAWSELTPPGSWDYGAIAVEAGNPQVVMAAPTTDDFPTPIFRSVDGGATWSQISFVRTPSVPWWPAGFWTGHTSSLLIDPRDRKQVYYTDYYGTWKTADITQTPSQWQSLSRGHEETEPFILRSPPLGAPLLSGMADVDGFRHASLDEYPAARCNGPRAQDGDTTGLDYCQADANQIVRVGEERGGAFRGASSVDNGRTWSLFPSLPFVGAHSGRVAVSATDCRLSVWVPEGSFPFRTADSGATWTRAQGAPTRAIIDRWDYSHPLASDRVDGQRFYLYKDRAFYTSADGGLSWQKTASLPAPPFDPRTGAPGPSVKAAPGRRAQVYVCLQEAGLYRSADAGRSFRKLRHVGFCQLFAFGRPAAGQADAALFVYGVIDGEEGIFRADDGGRSYVRIDMPQQPLGDQAMVLEGDPRVFGRVYVGTNGRGTFYGEPVVSDSGLPPS